MKKNKKELIVLTLICIFFGCSPIAVNALNNVFVLESCANILGAKMVELLNYVFFIIRVATPVLVVFFITMDFVKAVAASKEEDMKKAQNSAIKRIIIGVVIFFIPTIIKLILWLVGRTDTACTFN